MPRRNFHAEFLKADLDAALALIKAASAAHFSGDGEYAARVAGEAGKILSHRTENEPAVRELKRTIRTFSSAGQN